MLKKFYLAFMVLVFLPLLAIAHDDYRDGHFHPYLGITGGLGAEAGYYRATGYDPPGPFPKKGDRYGTIGKTTGLAGGVVGVQVAFHDHFFFAIQGNALWHSLNGKTVFRSTDDNGINNHIVHLRNNFQFGLDTRLGVFVKKAMAYAIVGAEAGRWKMALLNPSSVSNVGIPANSKAHSSAMRWGPKVGVGVTHPIYKKLFGNIEYSYTWYGSLHKTLVDFTGNIHWKHRANIRQNTILLGLNYVF